MVRLQKQPDKIEMNEYGWPCPTALGCLYTIWLHLHEVLQTGKRIEQEKKSGGFQELGARGKEEAPVSWDKIMRSSGNG